MRGIWIIQHEMFFSSVFLQLSRSSLWSDQISLRIHSHSISFPCMPRDSVHMIKKAELVWLTLLWDRTQKSVMQTNCYFRVCVRGVITYNLLSWWMQNRMLPFLSLYVEYSYTISIFPHFLELYKTSNMILLKTPPPQKHVLTTRLFRLLYL